MFTKNRQLSILMILVVTWLTCQNLQVEARSITTPWNQQQEYTFQNLVYGSSTPWDVQRVMGRGPDEVVKAEYMYPVVENHNFYDENGSGNSSVFVFENGFLVGFHMRMKDNQLVDLTYFLTNNGDRRLNNAYNAGIWSYNPLFPLYNTPFGQSYPYANNYGY